MSKINDMTIKEAKAALDDAKKTVAELSELSELFRQPVEHAEISSSAPIGELGRPVIVRSRDMGVVFGEYAGNHGDTVHLAKARQLWNWTAKKGGTLLDCAQYGVKKGKFSHENDAVTIFNACGIIDCTDEAAKSIRDIDVSFS